MSKFNEVLFLFQGDCCVTQNNHKISCVVTIKQQWFPSVQIIAEFSIPLHGFVFGEAILSFSQFNLEEIIYIYAMHPYLAYFKSNSVLRSNFVSSNKIMLHLVNFNDYSRAVVQSFDGRSIGTNRLELVNEDWKITIDAIPLSRKLWEENRNENNGYIITNVVVLESIDGQKKNLSAIEDEIINLYWFLSFMAGRRVGFIDIIDVQSNTEIWIRQLITPYTKQMFNWSHTLKFTRDNNLTNLYAEYCKTPLRKFLQEDYIYWYLKALSNDVNDVIINGQTALENITREFIVEHLELLLEDDFEHLKAAVKVRIIMKLLSINVEIPKRCESIIKRIKKDKIKDIPQILPSFRNPISHGKKKKFAFDEQIEVSKIMLDLLEEIFFKILKVNFLPIKKRL